MIEVKNLVKNYGNHLAVDDLSFTVEKGQILGFLGPNGAGKSTTMNMITGYISATSGTVTINGHDIFDDPIEAKKMIGYLPEIPPLYPDMTVLEYLKFTADIKAVKKQEKAKMIQDIIHMTKIDDVKERLIKQLSKGYKQRVGLAGAIVGYPEVLILDEPTVGLDPMQIIEIRDLIKRLSKKHTIILSSHILSEVSAVCDKVMIINKGKLIVSDTPQNLSKHMEGADRLKLLVKGDRKQIKEALDQIEDVEHIDYKVAKEEGLFEVNIQTNENIDIREEVFYALSKADCPIYGMERKVLSLEDIFLELTKIDNKKSSRKGNRIDLSNKKDSMREKVVEENITEKEEE
ncbi:MAG TPA: ABC transporter ATP-binding protein [Lachnospiraceae bacterium]|nr:ABC transporter ATP-binding protein [Lachnospiraceae bacterium]